MDNISIKGVVGKLRLLKFSFGGVWSADNFPRMNSGPRFQIVNTSPKNFKGTSLAITCSHSINIQKLSQTKKNQEINKHCNLEQPENSAKFFHSFPGTI